MLPPVKHLAMIFFHGGYASTNSRKSSLSKLPVIMQFALEKEGGDNIIRSLEENTNLYITNFTEPNTTGIDFGVKRQPSFNANLKVIREKIHELVEIGNEVVILAESKDLTKRIEDL